MAYENIEDDMLENNKLAEKNLPGHFLKVFAQFIAPYQLTSINATRTLNLIVLHLTIEVEGVRILM